MYVCEMKLFFLFIVKWKSLGSIAVSLFFFGDNPRFEYVL